MALLTPDIVIVAKAVLAGLFLSEQEENNPL